MDQMNITVGKDGGDTIELIAESELSRFDKSSDLMYTNASQQQRFSGDLAFNYMHVIEVRRSSGVRVTRDRVRSTILRLRATSKKRTRWRTDDRRSQGAQ